MLLIKTAKLIKVMGLVLQVHNQSFLTCDQIMHLMAVVVVVVVVVETKRFFDKLIFECTHGFSDGN